MSLLDEILTGDFDLQNRDDGLIASTLSIGRTKIVPTEVGNGTIIEILGISTGNSFLDAIYNNPVFKYIKPLLEQGRLRLDSPMVRATIDSFVPTILSIQEAEALKAFAEVPDHITPQQVAVALEGI